MKSFIIFPYKKPFETVYATVLKPPLENHGFEAVRADEIPATLNRNATSDLFYYPVDENERMLTAAVQGIASDTDLLPRLRLKAIHADFENLALFQPVYDFRPAPNIFLFLGNTLGNIRGEFEFLNVIRAAMHRHDILIIEVRLRTGPLRLGGKLKDQKSFSFAPLYAIGFQYYPGAIAYRKENATSHIPGTVTISSNTLTRSKSQERNIRIYS